MEAFLREVSFKKFKSSRKIGKELTCASNKDEIKKRKIKVLLKASELLKCKNLLIITRDYEDHL